MELKEKMWAMVQVWEESGMTKQEFLSDKGIGQPKFDYWLYKLRAQHTGTRPQLPAQSTQETFKSFVFGEEARETDPQSVSMEIVTPSGVRITIYH